MLYYHSPSLHWYDLKVSPNELRLDTLRSGQSFRWRQQGELWACIIEGKLCIIKETKTTILYGLTFRHDTSGIDEILSSYFQLNRVCLADLYERWSEIDTNFKKKSQVAKGIRILRQDPLENVISFICSSNNNIARISQMIQKLCVTFGRKIAALDDVEYYDFPTIDSLAQKGVETTLRELGFGYRAKYIAETAKLLAQRDPTWLANLRNLPYEQTKSALLELPGVGPKVADCICLMSMDHAQAIPVDTHVWQIAVRDYKLRRRGLSLTAKSYNEVGELFRGLFGDYSGWAHSVLFTADLRPFAVKTDKKQVVKKKPLKDVGRSRILPRIKRDTRKPYD